MSAEQLPHARASHIALAMSRRGLTLSGWPYQWGMLPHMEQSTSTANSPLGAHVAVALAGRRAHVLRSCCAREGQAASGTCAMEKR
jgi:hypothetical protein